MGQVEIGRIPLSPEIVIAGSIYIVDLFRLFINTVNSWGRAGARIIYKWLYLNYIQTAIPVLYIQTAIPVS